MTFYADATPEGSSEDQGSSFIPSQPQHPVVIQCPPDPRRTTAADLAFWGAEKVEAGTELLNQTQRRIIKAESRRGPSVVVSPNAVLPYVEAEEIQQTLQEYSKKRERFDQVEDDILTSDDLHAPEVTADYLDSGDEFYVDSLGRVRPVSELGEETDDDLFGEDE